jgi:hypothetical protein
LVGLIAVVLKVTWDEGSLLPKHRVGEWPAPW